MPGGRAELKKKSNESGAGRFTDFSLPPLTFYEYLHLKGYANIMIPAIMEWQGVKAHIYKTVDQDKLNTLFLDYINYGGYPEVVFSEKIRENPEQFIRHDIIDKVLLRDLPSLYGINDVHFAMTYIFNNAIGALSPPMGTLMFVTCGITGCKTGPFIKEAVPFYILLVINLLLITYVPVFSTGILALLGD